MHLYGGTIDKRLSWAISLILVVVACTSEVPTNPAASADARRISADYDGNPSDYPDSADAAALMAEYSPAIQLDFIGGSFNSDFTSFGAGVVVEWAGINDVSVSVFGNIQDGNGSVLNSQTTNRSGTNLTSQTTNGNVSLVANMTTNSVTCGLVGKSSTTYKGQVISTNNVNSTPITMWTNGDTQAGTDATEPACSGGGGLIDDCYFEDGWEVVAVYDDDTEIVLWEGSMYWCTQDAD